jgi:hypothetical protein
MHNFYTGKFLFFLSLRVYDPGVEELVMPGFVVFVDGGPDKTEVEHQTTDPISEGTTKSTTPEGDQGATTVDHFDINKLHPKRLTVS